MHVARRLPWQPAAIWFAVSAVVALVQLWRWDFSVVDMAEHYRTSGADYLVIATEGYPAGTWRIGWFPGFPMVVAAAQVMSPFHVGTTAVLVSCAAAIAALTALWVWMTDRGTSGPARLLGILAMLLSPAGWVLIGIAYSEAVFLAFAIWACVAVERRRPWIAAVLLVGACLTRFAGVAVVACLVVRSLEQDGAVSLRPWRAGGKDDGSSSPRRWQLPFSWSRDQVSPRVFIPLFGLVGTAAFFGYSWIWHGHPFAYFAVQRQLVPSPPLARPTTWIHLQFFKHFISELGAYLDAPGYMVGSVINAVMTVLVALLVPGVARRFGLGYAVLVGIVVGMIWFAAWDFSSASRYLLAAFPAAALVGERVADRRPVWVVGLALAAVAMLASDYTTSILV